MRPQSYLLTVFGELGLLDFPSFSSARQMTFELTLAGLILSSLLELEECPLPWSLSESLSDDSIVRFLEGDDISAAGSSLGASSLTLEDRISVILHNRGHH